MIQHNLYFKSSADKNFLTFQHLRKLLAGYTHLTGGVDASQANLLKYALLSDLVTKWPPTVATACLVICIRLKRNGF